MNNKTIILSSENKTPNGIKAILTLITDNSTLKGKMRLYNANTLPLDSKIGVYYKEKIHTATITKSQDTYNFEINQNFDLTNDIYCAVLDKKNIFISGGSYGNMFFNENSIFYGDASTTEDVEEYIDKCVDQDCEYEAEEQSSIDTNEKCDNCVYKKDFFENKSTPQDFFSIFKNENSESTQIKKLKPETHLQPKEIIKNADSTKQLKIIKENMQTISKQKIQKDKQEYNSEAPVKKSGDDIGDFLSMISEQIDEMLVKYPTENTIMELVPNSKFIKIEDEYENNTYIIGVIYEKEKIKYLAYGVPAKYNTPAPKELGTNYQWIPIDLNDPMTDGYYVLYQDAIDGSIIKFTYG